MLTKLLVTFAFGCW